MEPRAPSRTVTPMAAVTEERTGPPSGTDAHLRIKPERGGNRRRRRPTPLEAHAQAPAGDRATDVAEFSTGGQDDAMTQRRLVSSGAQWEPVVGYSRAVRVGQWVSVAGTTAAADGGGAVGGDDVGDQAREALRRVVAALEAVGAGPEHVVRTRIFVTDISRWEEVGRAHGEVFGDVRPATSMVEVSRLIDAALLVEIEADAVVP